jgi:hypothetical protein
MTLPIDTILPSDDLPVVIEPTSVPDRADAPVSEITERFLKMVIAHVPLDRIEELHLFSPLRQGGVETGIAVIAARVPVLALSSMEPELPFDEVVSDAAPVDAPVEEPTIEVAEAAAVDAEVVVEAPAPRIRHTVLTARYRLVQKGPDRGKWEADVVAEADAPLVTVDLVVRGVQRRAGEESEIVRYSSAQLARALHMPLPPV